MFNLTSCPIGTIKEELFLPFAYSKEKDHFLPITFTTTALSSAGIVL